MKYLIHSYLWKSVSLCLFLLACLSVHVLLASGFTYHWGHPSPQGNSVYGIAFKDANNGWAVTGCGSILKTSDGGQNWELTLGPDSTCNDLYDILISDQGTLIVSGEQGRIMRSTDNGENWQILSITGTGNLFDLAPIPSGGISAAGENGSILVSTDDGINWINKGPGGTGYARGHYWKSATEGYVVGYGLFHRTFDGGNTWTQIATPGVFGLNEIYFVDENTGYALEDFKVWKTTDGGNSWSSTSQVIEPLYRYRTLAIDEIHWFSVTNAEGAALWETFDAGASWQLKFNYYTTGFLSVVENGNRLLFSSDIGDIFYSDDEGTNVQDAVQNLAVFPSAPIMVIGKKPDGTLFANNQPNSGINNGTFFRSDDGGISWYVPDAGQNLRWVTDIGFFDNQFGILGAYSDIRYTTDGGETWEQSNLPADFNLTNFALPASDRYFAGTYGSWPNGGGNLYKSSDHGVTWEAVGGGLPIGQIYISNVAFASENEGYIACQINNSPVMYKTTDGGITWNLIDPTGISDFISDMVWLDENTGLAAVPNGATSGMYRTTDGGLNWTWVSTTGARQLTRGIGDYIAAVNPGDALFQESADGGLTWTSYSPPFSTGISGFGGGISYIQATETGYVIGGSGNKLMAAEREITTGTVFNHDETDHIYPEDGIAISPNPVKDMAVISFDLSSDQVANLSIADMQGQIIHTFLKKNLKAGKHEIMINVNDLNPLTGPGIYFIMLTTNRSFYSAKMILSD